MEKEVLSNRDYSPEELAELFELFLLFTEDPTRPGGEAAKFVNMDYDPARRDSSHPRPWDYRFMEVSRGAEEGVYTLTGEDPEDSWRAEIYSIKTDEVLLSKAGGEFVDGGSILGFNDEEKIPQTGINEIFARLQSLNVDRRSNYESRPWARIKLIGRRLLIGAKDTPVR